MRFRGTKVLASVGVAAVVLVIAACGSSSSSSTTSSSSGASSTSSSSSSGNGGATAPGVTATSITFGTHQPLTGPAAPGYSEIAPASQAFFDYVNAHGGVFGRKIHLIIKDDAYNPTNTVNVVHQLVLQNNVFGIFEGLGTPTHTKVVGFLNASKIPDLFVASGCPCWDNGTTQPYTFGWQPNYTIEGKILGQYIKQHFAGQKVGVLYQDDDFGQGGLAGIEDEVPAADIVSKQPYQSGATTLAPQITAIKSSGAKVARRLHRADLHRDRPADLVHARLQARSSSSPTSASTRPPWAACSSTISKGKASGTALIEGAITDGYLPVQQRHVEPVDPAVHEDPRSVRPERAVRRQRRVRDGERVHARTGAQGGRQEPHPPGPGQRGQQVRRHLDRDRALSRSAIRRPSTAATRGRRWDRSAAARSCLFGGPLTTASDRRQPDHPVHRDAADAAGQGSRAVEAGARPRHSRRVSAHGAAARRPARTCRGASAP